MYSVLLDKNNYFTGTYAETGFVVGGVNVPILPPDMAKATCYRLEDDNWVYDDGKWEQMQIEATLASIREQRNTAFLLIDRYQLTLIYESLTLEQRAELAEYRQSWLDSPETLVIPVKPDWMV